MQLVSPNSLRLHPQAELVPRMSEAQAQQFESDVKARGIRVPIELTDGSTVVDGRSRYLAAKKLGLEQVPVIEAPLNGEDPVLYMLRAASKRRHLTEDQLACLALEEMKVLSALSKKERAKKAGEGNRTDNLAATSSAKSRDRANDSRTVVSARYGVSERKIRAAKKIDEISPELFEQAKSGQTRLAEARRQAEREARTEELAVQFQAAAGSNAAQDWEVRLGDCLDELKNIEPGKVKLIFADPPYNIGIDYGSGSENDSLPVEQYLDWCRQWIEACVPLLTDDGSMWVMINDQHADYFGVMLRKTGMLRRAWIKWYETFGVNCERNFNRCSRHIFYHVKDPKKFTFNKEAITRPSVRLQRYQDQRAALGGKLWDNVWCIPRLVENSNERIPGFPTQLPLDLVRPIVSCASDPGDLILDPFCGSGTTGVAAIESHRRFIGIEKNPKFHELASRRLTTLASLVA